MKITACIAATAIFIGAWAASFPTTAGEGQSISQVNGSVRTTAGQTYDTLSSVNGDVRVEQGVVADAAHTVNGDIVLESDAKVGSVKTVNGSLTIGAGVTVAREASTVNGGVKLAERSHVGGTVSTVSGDIEVDGGEVAGKLTTNNGDIDLTGGARVRGGIYVKKNNSWNSHDKDDPIKVHVCSTCVVEGELRFERPVELRVDQGGKIGNVIGDAVTRR